MNRFHSRPGIIFIGTFVLVVCLIPLLGYARHSHDRQDWRDGTLWQQRVPIG